MSLILNDEEIALEVGHLPACGDNPKVNLRYHKEAVHLVAKAQAKHMGEEIIERFRKNRDELVMAGGWKQAQMEDYAATTLERWLKQEGIDL